MLFLLGWLLCEKFHKVDACIVEDCDDLSSPVSSFLKESEKVLVESDLIQDWLMEATPEVRRSLTVFACGFGRE